MVEPTFEEIINWITTGLKDGRLEPRIMRDDEGNITYIYTVPTRPFDPPAPDPPAPDPRRAHRQDRRRTRPL